MKLSLRIVTGIVPESVFGGIVSVPEVGTNSQMREQALVAKWAVTVCEVRWCRLTVKNVVLVALVPLGSLTTMSLIDMLGGPSSLTMVPIAEQPSGGQIKPPPCGKTTVSWIVSSGSIALSPQIVTAKFKVPGPDSDGMENGRV